MTDEMHEIVDQKVGRVEGWLREHEKSDNERFDRADGKLDKVDGKLNKLIVAVGVLTVAVGSPKVNGPEPSEVISLVLRAVGAT